MIQLPSKFEAILQKDKTGFFIGVVNTARSKFNEIFVENNLYFFPEYTDHGIRHINSVLQACANIITSDTYDLLNEKDISILILGVFLHDLGMHLQPLTLKNMITGKYDDVINKEFGDEKWSVLWKNYFFEAKKFNDRQLINLFGKADIEITIPDLDTPDSLTDEQKKLIGEFIRRHHPRIAYEIAFKGIVSSKKEQIFFCDDLDKEFKVLAGILARSHGMNVRDTFKVLESNYDKLWRKPLGVQIIYLMMVLRLGDYFQIDSTRVLKVPFLTKSFQSPVSFAEHEKHLQTKEAQDLDDDPETLYIRAEPLSSTYFLALSNLFYNIQAELDQSWAVLGEIYGTKPYRDQPKLKYRRVRSNLDDKKSIENKFPFVPDRVSFIIDKEISKLLVIPLYNYDPSFGVRELLQNAVDACIERDFYEKHRKEDYDANIDISIYKVHDDYFFSICDNGKGMTLDEIKDYFLTVGGTLRKSLQWQIAHVDDNGRSNINKAGRFGIGVLAAYLLGAEIEVRTKSLFSKSGYVFKTTLDQEQVEITKNENLPDGTTIIIGISEKILKGMLSKDRYMKDSVRFDKWYVLRWPKVNYNILGLPATSFGYKEFLPGLLEKMSNRWHEIKEAGYKKIAWAYNENEFYTNNRFYKTIICNGFIIPENYGLADKSINSPTLLIFDFDARLPLNLNRTIAHTPLDFDKPLEMDIYKDVLAKILLAEVRNPFEEESIVLTENRIAHPSIPESADHEDPLRIAYCKDGFTLNSPSLLKNYGKNMLWLIVKEWKLEKEPFDISKFKNADIISISKNDSITGVPRIILNSIKSTNQVLSGTWNMLESIKTRNKAQTKSLEIDKNIEVLKLPASIDAICYKIDLVEERPIPLFEMVAKILGNDCIIPYEISARKKKYPKAFAALKKYMLKYLAKSD